MTALSTRDRLGVRFLTLCLPAGPVRTRYRREFRSELATMPPAEHAGYLLRLLSRMPLLAAEIDRPRRLVLEPGTEFEPTLRCRLRLGHRWADAYTEDGHHYRKCRSCGRDRQGASSGPNDGVMLGAQTHGWM